MSTRNPPILVRRSPIHGTGVYAARRIRKSEEIIFYEGRLITHEQAEEDEDNGHTFLFTLNDDWVIEAAIDGNDARWINHSCDPNCEALLIEDDDGDRRKDKIVIQAMRTIQPGEELTYDYNILTEEEVDDETRRLWRCLCGAHNCTGVIVKPGVPEGSRRGRKKGKGAAKGSNGRTRSAGRGREARKGRNGRTRKARA